MADPSSKEPAGLAYDMLLRAHSPDTAAEIFAQDVVKKRLPLRASSPTPSARALRRRAQNQRKQADRKRSKLKPRPLSAAHKRKLGLYDLSKEERNYTLYEGLHKLWLGYMQDILGVAAEGAVSRTLVSPAQAGPVLVSADMHGACLEVVQSRCVGRVGLKGIVVKDTKFTFEIITKHNALKAIPKEHTMFRFEIPFPPQSNAETPKPLVFDIFGDVFQNRPQDRANKKYKMHHVADI